MTINFIENVSEERSTELGEMITQFFKAGLHQDLAPYEMIGQLCENAQTADEVAYISSAVTSMLHMLEIKVLKNKLDLAVSMAKLLNELNKELTESVK